MTTHERREVRILEQDAAFLGLRLLLAAEQRGLTLETLAKRAHLTLSVVQHIVSGTALRPSVWTIDALATILHVSIDYLVHGEEQP